MVLVALVQVLVLVLELEQVLELVSPPSQCKTSPTARAINTSHQKGREPKTIMNEQEQPGKT